MDIPDVTNYNHRIVYVHVVVGAYRTVHDQYTCMFTMQIEMIVLVCLGEHNEVVHFEPYVDPAAAPRHAALPKHNHPHIELFFSYRFTAKEKSFINIYLAIGCSVCSVDKDGFNYGRKCREIFFFFFHISVILAFNLFCRFLFSQLPTLSTLRMRGVAF